MVIIIQKLDFYYGFNNCLEWLHSRQLWWDWFSSEDLLSPITVTSKEGAAKPLYHFTNYLVKQAW